MKYENLKMKTTVLILSICISVILNGQTYKRIVSLSPAASFNLTELGCEDKIAGVTSYCDLAANENLVVASAISMNMEKVLMLQPDLVIYTTMFKPAQIERLKQMGIHTEMFASPKNFEETCTQFIRLGELVGKKAQALQYVDSVKKEMVSIQNTIPKGKKPKMFIEIGSKPLFTAIPGTFMQDYIDVMGGVNIAADQTSGTISREKVIQQNPDYIIIVTMGIVSQKEKEMWEGYPQLSAVKNNKVFIVDATMSCRPTPYNFISTIKELNRLMYGKR